MKLKDLVSTWEKSSCGPLTEKEYAVKISAKDAAKLAALHEMYPTRTIEQIITELLSAALNELEYTLPYVQGNEISSIDELGDPIYKDVGPTSKFAELTRKHLNNNRQH